MAYGDDQGLIEYLSRTGRSLPSGADPAVLREIGSDYVDSFEDLFCGNAETVDASFPRDIYPEVPKRVEQAAYEAGYAYATGVPIFGEGGTSGGQVIREKVDVLEVSYSDFKADWWTANRFILPLAYTKLLPFICPPNDGKCSPIPTAAVVV